MIFIAVINTQTKTATWRGRGSTHLLHLVREVRRNAAQEIGGRKLEAGSQAEINYEEDAYRFVPYGLLSLFYYVSQDHLLRWCDTFLGTRILLYQSLIKKTLCRVPYRQSTGGIFLIEVPLPRKC